MFTFLVKRLIWIEYAGDGDLLRLLPDRAERDDAEEDVVEDRLEYDDDEVVDGEDEELEVDDEERDEDLDLLEDRSRLLRLGLLAIFSSL